MRGICHRGGTTLGTILAFLVSIWILCSSTQIQQICASLYSTPSTPRRLLGILHYQVISYEQNIMTKGVTFPSTHHNYSIFIEKYYDCAVFDRTNKR